MSPGAPFVDELRRELLAAARREVRRRRRRPLVAAVAAGAAAVVAVVLVLVPRPATAAAEVVVRVRHGFVEVALVDLEHRPERIEAAVREAGLDVRVRSVPVGPSSVGRFVGEDSGGTLPGELEPVDDGPAGFRGFLLPVGWSGQLHLLVGVPAGEREVWARFSDATAPGEALACRAVVGRRAAVVAAELADSPVAVRYRADGPEGIRVVRPVELQSPPWSGWLVGDALGTRRGEVVVHLVPPSAAPAAEPPHPGCSR